MKTHPSVQRTNNIRVRLEASLAHGCDKEHDPASIAQSTLSISTLSLITVFFPILSRSRPHTRQLKVLSQHLASGSSTVVDRHE